MENQKNNSNNLNSTVVWIIIGVLVLIAIVFLVINNQRDISNEQENKLNQDFLTDPIGLEDPQINPDNQGEDPELLNLLIEQEREKISQELSDDLERELRLQCENDGGIWLGGAEKNCEINNDIYSVGNLFFEADMTASCLYYGGKWLGGNNFECEIDGQVYPGNWEFNINSKKSCIEYNGEWIGGNNLECKIDGNVYTNREWEI